MRVLISSAQYARSVTSVSREPRRVDGTVEVLSCTPSLSSALSPALYQASVASMRLLYLLLLVAFTHALHSYEVGVTDWHKPLAGVPLVQSPSTAPVFHRRRYRDGQTSSVVLTATQSNVLAAIHSANGSIGEWSGLRPWCTRG